MDDEKTESGAEEPLAQFVQGTGTQVMGRHRDKRARTVETLCDLDLAFAGAESLASRSEPSEGRRWTAALARACSVFLRKMVIGDWNDSWTRLLDRSVLESAGLSFHKTSEDSARASDAGD